MKCFLALACSVLFCGIITGQTNRIDSILRDPEMRKPYYEMEMSGSKVLYLPMTYGKSSFSNNQLMAVKKLANAQIGGIDLVYSDYPAKADFSPLNRKRLESLRDLLPGVFSNTGISFRKIRQTAAHNKEEASWLTHGFYIYFREMPGKASTEKEISKIKAVFDTVAKKKTGLKGDSSGISKICSSWTVLADTADVSEFIPLKVGFTRSITKMSYKKALNDSLLLYGMDNYYKNFDSVYYILDTNDDSCASWDGVYSYMNVDSTVSRVFERHRWNNAMIVGDVTGSMYPYSTQLLLWLKLTMTDGLRRQFVFFNDGDMKRDDEKTIGNTGGIYQVATGNFKEVEKTILRAMTNGSGGDAPENNMEALLAAVKECPACDSIVMIADNWAPVKDISLISSFTKPVKVVLCGVFGSVNPDYLNIARKTGGSLHLIERDIYELSKMKEGDVIDIGGSKYKIVDGSFRLLERKSL